MLRATTIVRQPAVKADRVVDTISLDHEGRHRRRVALKATGGTEFLLDLEKATAVKGGDAFKLEDGRLIRVEAAPQTLIEVRAETPTRLARLAWHIGNRHTPAEITGEAIYLEDDHVLAEMLRGLGGAVSKVSRPFEPERGAYEGHGGHAHHAHHGHGHDHSHDHDHHQDHHHDHHHGHAPDHQHHNAAESTSRDRLDLGHQHGHSHDHAHDHDHAGRGCDCGHDHGHHHDHAHHHDGGAAVKKR